MIDGEGEWAIDFAEPLTGCRAHGTAHAHIVGGARLLKQRLVFAKRVGVVIPIECKAQAPGEPLVYSGIWL